MGVCRYFGSEQTHEVMNKWLLLASWEVRIEPEVLTCGTQDRGQVFSQYGLTLAGE